MKEHLSRRNLIRFGAGALGAGILAEELGSELISPQAAVAENNITPNEALQKLIDGNRRFLFREQKKPNRSYARLLQVANGQKPFASILSCADSRVPAEMLFDQGFGDLFVCRVAGNVATPEEIASLEYGAFKLGTKVIMVMGHKRCGAVTAAMTDGEFPGHISTLISAIKPAVKNVKGKYGDALENACKENALLQIKTLMTSPVLGKLVEEKKLKIVAGYYDLDTGKVSLVA